MPKRILVCFNCRTTKPVIDCSAQQDQHRTPSSTCPQCRNDMKQIGNGHPIPKKRDVKKWKQYEQWVRVHYPIK